MNLVPQVQVVAILMIVNGALVTLMGLLYALMVPFMVNMMSFAPPGPGGAAGPSTTQAGIIYAIYLAIGLPVAAVGVLNIVAGIRCLRLRGRILALVALFSNLVPMFTCYCLPTSLGLMIYGLIVLFQADVAFAFAEVAAGAPPERFKYARRHPDDEDDFDDQPPPRRPSPRPSDNVQSYPDEYHRPRHDE